MKTIKELANELKNEICAELYVRDYLLMAIKSDMGIYVYQDFKKRIYANIGYGINFDGFCYWGIKSPLEDIYLGTFELCSDWDVNYVEFSAKAVLAEVKW